jgi:hypothetical protein
MINPLFADFLEDEAAYRASERYWEQMQDEIVSALGTPYDWPRYQLLYYGDGTPVGEPGDPIWDARSDALGRAFRIIQHAPTRMDVPEITAFIESRDDKFYEGSVFPKTELVIALALSEETAVLARELLQRWMSETTTMDDMKALLQERLGVET